MILMRTSIYKYKGIDFTLKSEFENTDKFFYTLEIWDKDILVRIIPNLILPPLVNLLTPVLDEYIKKIRVDKLKKINDGIKGC